LPRAGEEQLAAPDEKMLVRRAIAGDFAAFETLVALHERRLYALAWHLTRDHHDAQDVVQNSLMAAVEHLADFRGESSFGTWVSRILTNNALKLLRGRRLRKGLPLDFRDEQGEEISPPQFIADWRDDPTAAIDRRELREVLDAGVAELPEGQRLVFVLRDIEGMSVQETARAIGISPGNVKVRLMRARLALREHLTARFGDESTRRQRPEHDHARLIAKRTGGQDRSAGGGEP
jgi:RNA polymerase sigma-70 factor (ECF subfamily)